jgi:recombination protein RecT
VANLAEVKQQAQKTELVTVESFLKKNETLIKNALQNTITPERFMAVTNIVMQSPALQGCSQKSLLAAVLQTVQVGLIPGQIGHVYYVPRRNHGELEVQMIIGYRGLVELINRSKEATILSAFVVYEKDQFDYEYGLNPTLRHRPATGERGAMIGVYCIAMNNIAKEKTFIYIQREEVEKVKNESLKNIPQERLHYSPWVKWEESMWLKTSVRRIAKLLPLAVEVQQKIEADETIKTHIAEKMVDSPDKTEWVAEEAVITQPEGVDKPASPEVVSTDAKPALSRFKPGEEIPEIAGVVVGFTEKKITIKGKPGSITRYVVKTEHGELLISKFGGPKEGVENSECVFSGVQVSEWRKNPESNPVMQFLASDVVVIKKEEWSE